MGLEQLFMAENLVPLVVGIIAVVVIIKVISSVIKRIVSIAVAAVIIGGGQQAGAFEGLGALSHFFS